MLSIENLSVEFAAKPLFQEVSFVINPRDRIALVGKNGAGKSTMLKIIAGIQEPTSGLVSVPRDITIGYLPQVMQLSDRHTVRQEAEQAFANIHQIQAEIDDINAELAQRTDYESPAYMQLVERFTMLDERFRMMGGENRQAQLERTLTGLGFLQSDIDRPTSEFSGGWRMRVELAKILLQSPDVLLLDEPTNHLDIQSIQWFEQFLKDYQGALVMVSHDRAFINNVTARTIEISCGQIYDYKVPYDQYVVLRAERREQQLRAYENQQREIADTKAFIERFRYQATKANQVQSRIKALERIIPIEIDEVDNSRLQLHFTCSQRSGDFPLICDEVSKSYGDHTVFSHVSLQLKRGEKVAFVGRNGEGKTTLVRCIMGQIPFEGMLKIGHNVQIGYFAQNQAQLLDPELTVFDTVDQAARGDIRTKIRDILAAFMFGGEASEKKVKVLSGGERTRLAMIKLLLEPANLLILDEPTNHLDLPSKEVLKQALMQFPGTVILVSHDRQFLDGLVTSVYEFASQRVRHHLGGIYDYLQSLSPSSPSPFVKSSASSSVSPDVSSSSSSAGRDEWQQQKAQARLRKHAEQAVQQAEQQVVEIEQAIRLLEERLSTPEGSSQPQLFLQHKGLQDQLAKAEQEWETAMLGLQQLEADA